MERHEKEHGRPGKQTSGSLGRRGRLRLPVLPILILLVPLILACMGHSDLESPPPETAFDAQAAGVTIAQLVLQGNTVAVKATGSPGFLPQELVEQMKGIDQVTKVEPYLLFREPLHWMIGAEPGAALRLLTRTGDPVVNVTAGRVFTEADNGQLVVVISSHLSGGSMAGMGGASSLQVGESFFLEGGLRVRVLGLFSPGRQPEDTLFLSLDTLQELLNAKGKLTHIYVTADTKDNLPQVRKKIVDLLLEVQRKAGR